MTVRKIRAKLVLQLRAEGLSGRAIAASQGMSRKSITAVLEAADATETSWDDVAGLTDEQVYARLFPGRGEHESVFAQPDWEQVHWEMAGRQLRVSSVSGRVSPAGDRKAEQCRGTDKSSHLTH